MRLSRGVGNTVPEAFVPWYQRTVEGDLSALRTYAMWRAADFVLRAEARNWLDPHDVLWSSRRVYRGSCDDESLVAVLTELESLRLDQERPK